MPWADGLTFPDPPSTQILVDTLALGVGGYTITLMIRSTIGIEVVMERRNATNTVTRQFQIIPCTFSWTYVLIRERIILDAGERIRLRPNANVVGGEVQASIYYDLDPVYILRRSS